jgi:TonB family protein
MAAITQIGTERRAPKYLRIVIAALCTALPAHAGELRIIANSSVKTDVVTPAEIKSVFLLRTKSLKDGSLVVPVLLRSGAVQKAFLKQYIGFDEMELRTYYQGLVFTGKAPMPKEFESEDELIAYVAQCKECIGFVGSPAKTDGVKVLLVVSEQNKAERTLLKRVEPVYPETLVTRGITGAVRLELTIAPNGSVGQVQLLGGNPILAEAAENAVKQWIYSAAPVSSRVEVTIPFGTQR